MSHFICSYWTTSSTSNEPSNLHQWEATYISENGAITSPPMSHYISEAPSLLKQWASTASLSQPSHLHVAMSHLIKNYTLSIMLYSSKFFVFFSNCFTTILVYCILKQNTVVAIFQQLWLVLARMLVFTSCHCVRVCVLCSLLKSVL